MNKSKQVKLYLRKHLSNNHTLLLVLPEDVTWVTHLGITKYLSCANDSSLHASLLTPCLGRWPTSLLTKDGLCARARRYHAYCMPCIVSEFMSALSLMHDINIHVNLYIWTVLPSPNHHLVRKVDQPSQGNRPQDWTNLENAGCSETEWQPFRTDSLRGYSFIHVCLICTILGQLREAAPNTLNNWVSKYQNWGSGLR